MIDPIVTEKVCWTCSVLKPLSAFNLNKRTHSGVSHKCKECVETARYVRSGGRLTRPKVLVTEKPCQKCKVVKPATDYYSNKYMKDNLQSICKACCKAAGIQVAKTRIVLTEKVCTICKVLQPASEFHYKRTTRSRLNSKCKTCMKHAHRRNVFGISKEEFESMKQSQRGQCALCGRDPETVHKFGFIVDHCHASGEIRGLLCFFCNTGIGMFGDSPERVNAAYRYLLKHRQLALVV